MAKKEKFIDAGVSDKRLLCKATEFASILKVLAREGNTLSATMRDAWDGQDLRILTKNSPARATEPHISVIAHITEGELAGLLSETEQANGFGNRFLYVSTRKSKLLPEGGNLDSTDLAEELADLAQAIEFGRGCGELPFDDEARKLWHEVYTTLSLGHPGMFGALTGRAEAQVRRVACIYAILDLSTQVTASHLRAALAVWKYSEDSCRRVFRGSTGNTVADKILKALQANSSGMSRTDIRDLLGRNVTKPKVDAALGVLYRLGLARRTRLDRAAGGRPTEWWSRVVVADSPISGMGEANGRAIETSGTPLRFPALPGELQ